MLSFSSYWQLNERQHRGLDRRERGGDAHHDAGLSVLELLLVQGVRQDGEHHAVHADGGLDHVRGVGGAFLGVEVLDLLAGELLVVA